LRKCKRRTTEKIAMTPANCIPKWKSTMTDRKRFNLYGAVDGSCFVQGYAAESVTENNPFTCWVIGFGRRQSQRLHGEMSILQVQPPIIPKAKGANVSRIGSLTARECVRRAQPQGFGTGGVHTHADPLPKRRGWTRITRDPCGPDPRRTYAGQSATLNFPIAPFRFNNHGVSK